MDLIKKYNEVNYILESTLASLEDLVFPAIKQVKDFQSEVEQQQKDNDTLTDSIKKLEDEQKEGYKTFNTDTHILIERSVLYDLANDIDDVSMECDNAQDYASSVQCDLENIETYNAEETYDRCRSAKDSADDISDKINDILNADINAEIEHFNSIDIDSEAPAKKAPAKKVSIKVVEPKTQEGTK